MKLANLGLAACTAVLAACASTSGSQSFPNLGALLDKGAKRLDAAEVKALLTGATTLGQTFGGRLDAETTYGADGKSSGRFWGTHPEVNPGFSGTWQVNEQGQVCGEVRPASPHIPAGKGCGTWYVLDNAYYVSPSDDRGAVVRARKVSR